MVALDYRQDKVVANGWQTCEDSTYSEFLPHFRDQGISNFLLTSVENDGTMTGPDRDLADTCESYLDDIIIAGGVTSLEDVEFLSSKGFGAAVIGRSLYEGTLSLNDAIAAARRCSKCL